MWAPKIKSTGIAASSHAVDVAPLRTSAVLKMGRTKHRVTTETLKKGVKLFHAATEYQTLVYTIPGSMQARGVSTVGRMCAQKGPSMDGADTERAEEPEP